jgi:uncharacterized protein YdeI (YjbR/CyaY-like superfamily)
MPLRRSASGKPASKLDALEQVYVPTRAAWRRWLARHHARSPGIWLVFDKKSSRAERLQYAHAVEEALCFGWVDSTLRTLDHARYVQLFTPRKPKSTWSRSNKERVARLEAEGLMAPAGVAAVERAKANGSWSSLDHVESLVVPDDLAAALAATPGAADNFAAFSPSSRKGYLHWIRMAVRPETRAKRVAEVARHAAANRKARQLETATPAKRTTPAKAATPAKRSARATAKPARVSETRPAPERPPAARRRASSR